MPPTTPTVLSIVQAAMAKREISTAELARQTGLQRPNLSAWLNGRGDITVSTLERILEALKLKVR